MSRNIDIQTQLRQFIQEIENNKLNSYEAITKLSSLWSSFEESFLMMNSEVDLLDFRKKIIINLLKRKSELREHNYNLNKILLLQEIGVHFDELEIRRILFK